MSKGDVPGLQYGVVWYGVIWYGTVWYMCGMVWHGTVLLCYQGDDALFWCVTEHERMRLRDSPKAARAFVQETAAPPSIAVLRK